MSKSLEWSRVLYKGSISSLCWDYTPYDDGWGPAMAADNELMEIVMMERELGSVPEWAKRIVQRCIDAAQPCGHYLFPRGFLETIDAIGSQSAPKTFHSCFMVERERKLQAMDYGLCLDAWLAGARPEAVARELVVFANRRIDWASVCADLWEVLGERTVLKELLVERMLHRLRHSIKATVWDDDVATNYCKDEYLGDFTATHGYGGYGNPDFPPQGFDEASSPRVKRIELRIAEICARGSSWSEEWRPWAEWWLCAPKSFRFLERKLWEIGKLRRTGKGEEVPGFLRCEDTYPDQDEAAKWWASFSLALEGWWQGRLQKGDIADDVNGRLGGITPVKRWLVRLFIKKLKMLEANGEQFTQLISPKHDHKRGKKPIRMRPAG
jgi:hypothetical protein